MKLSRLNLLTALVSMAGAIAWLYLGSPVVALVWLAITAVWLVLAVLALRKREEEPKPFSRLLRRIYRLLIYAS